jgi:hypothetical protein
MPSSRYFRAACGESFGSSRPSRTDPGAAQFAANKRPLVIILGGYNDKKKTNDTKKWCCLNTNHFFLPAQAPPQFLASFAVM